MDDKVVFEEVDTTNILVGRPTAAGQDISTAIVVTTIAARPIPNGQD